MNRLLVLLGVITVAFTPAVANGATALLVGGRGGYAELTDEQMSTALGGFFGAYVRVSVPFPGSEDFVHSVDVGTQNLYKAVIDTLAADPQEAITIGGVSEGAPAIDNVLRVLMELPETDRPDPTRFNAMVYGAPNRLLTTGGGLAYQPFPDTPYDVMIVMAEYDGVSDWPDNPFNLLALINAVMGADELHVPAAWTDIFTVSTKYYVEHNDAGGTTTTVLIPTPLLPMLRPMLEWGFSPETVVVIDKLVRPIVDSAYRRPDWEVGIPPTLPTMDLSAPPAPITPGAAPAPEVSTATAPAPTSGDRAVATPDRVAAPPRRVPDKSTTEPDPTLDNRTGSDTDEEQEDANAGGLAGREAELQEPEPAGDEREQNVPATDAGRAEVARESAPAPPDADHDDNSNSTSE